MQPSQARESRDPSDSTLGLPHRTPSRTRHCDTHPLSAHPAVSTSSIRKSAMEGLPCQRRRVEARLRRGLDLLCREGSQHTERRVCLRGHAKMVAFFWCVQSNQIPHNPQQKPGGVRRWSQERFPGARRKRRRSQQSPTLPCALLSFVDAVPAADRHCLGKREAPAFSILWRVCRIISVRFLTPGNLGLPQHSLQCTWNTQAFKHREACLGQVSGIVNTHTRHI